MAHLAAGSPIPITLHSRRCHACGLLVYPGFNLDTDAAADFEPATEGRFAVLAVEHFSNKGWFAEPGEGDEPMTSDRFRVHTCS